MIGTLTLVLAHPHTLTREGIARILTDAGYQVVGQTDTGLELRRLALELQPEVVLVDWELPDVDAESIRALAEAVPSSSIVILTRPQPSGTVMSAMQAGASGYLTVNLSAEEFVHSLPMLAKGHVIISQEAAESFKESPAAATMHDGIDVLSQRELEVLGLVGHGATNREIAQRLIVTESTVKAHLRRILNKLNLRNRQQAAAYAAREDLVPNIEDLEDSAAIERPS